MIIAIIFFSQFTLCKTFRILASLKYFIYYINSFHMFSLRYNLKFSQIVSDDLWTHRESFAVNSVRGIVLDN